MIGSSMIFLDHQDIIMIIHRYIRFLLVHLSACRTQVYRANTPCTQDRRYKGPNPLNPLKNNIISRFITSIILRDCPKWHTHWGLLPYSVFRNPWQTPAIKAEKRRTSMCKWQPRWNYSPTGRWTFKFIPNITLWLVELLRDPVPNWSL